MREAPTGAAKERRGLQQIMDHIDGKDEYSADIRFGEWLRTQRTRAGLSIEVTARLAELSVRRLKGIEMGLSGRGITSQEARRLSATYGIDLAEIIDRASRA